MYFQIQPSSGVPLYRQIADEVKTAFLKGKIRPGDRLPSVRELAQQLRINPNTIVKAYDLLESERMITRRHGQGAFVADGDQPLHSAERRSQVREAARALAVEGRRLGFSESELLDVLETELAHLRPKGKGAP